MQSHDTTRHDEPSGVPSWALWTLQGLLAALFLFAGSMKLLMPAAALTQEMPQLPGLFIRFLGVCEVLGALGLILPGLLRFKTVLTPLAAAGLVIIMIGATVLSAVWFGVAMAIMPFVVGILAGFVAYCRWRLNPLNDIQPLIRVPLLS